MPVSVMDAVYASLALTYDHHFFALTFEIKVWNREN